MTGKEREKVNIDKSSRKLAVEESKERGTERTAMICLGNTLNDFFFYWDKKKKSILTSLCLIHSLIMKLLGEMECLSGDLMKLCSIFKITFAS